MVPKRTSREVVRTLYLNEIVKNQSLPGQISWGEVMKLSISLKNLIRGNLFGHWGKLKIN